MTYPLLWLPNQSSLPDIYDLSLNMVTHYTIRVDCRIYMTYPLIWLHNQSSLPDIYDLSLNMVTQSEFTARYSIYCMTYPLIWLHNQS